MKTFMPGRRHSPHHTCLASDSIGYLTHQSTVNAAPSVNICPATGLWHSSRAHARQQARCPQMLTMPSTRTSARHACLCPAAGPLLSEASHSLTAVQLLISSRASVPCSMPELRAGILGVCRVPHMAAYTSGKHLEVCCAACHTWLPVPPGMCLQARGAACSSCLAGTPGVCAQGTSRA